MPQKVAYAVTVFPIKFSDILAAPNSEELIGEYAEECSNPEIGPIDPQAGIYAQMENAGIMQAFAASDGRDLIGFANVLTSIYPHYGQKVATQESLFVASAYRNTSAGQQLRGIMRAYARDMGCRGIYWAAPEGSQYEAVLECEKNCTRTNAIFYENLS